MGEASARKVLELTGEALEAAIRERAAIRAYHGSPHVFDKFSLDRIGTGEGAQVYGHGLYFTEKEAIAKGYREKLAGHPQDKSLGIDGRAVWGRGDQGTHDEWWAITRALEGRMQPAELAVHEQYLESLPPGELRDLVHKMVDGPEAERTAWNSLDTHAQTIITAGNPNVSHRGHVLDTRGGAWDDRAFWNWQRLKELTEARTRPIEAKLKAATARVAELEAAHTAKYSDEKWIDGLFTEPSPELVRARARQQRLENALRAADVDYNFIHDIAPIRKARRLHRGLLELQTRAHFEKPGDLARVRGHLEAEIANYEKELAKGNAGFLSGSRSRDLYELEDKRAALYALDHYGPRLAILPPVTPGATYEVAIKAHPDTFLLWDKPMSEQPPAVQRALGYDPARLTEARAKRAEYEARIGAIDREIVRIVDGDAEWGDQAKAAASHARLDALNAEKSDLRDLLSGYDHVANMTGKDAWHAAVSAHGVPVTLPPGQGGRVWKGDPVAAAQALRDKGITGIKYLDGFSRHAGEGTHNYVVFDDAAVDILKRYGLAGLMAGGAAGYGQAGAGDVTVDHAGAGGKALSKAARELAGALDFGEPAAASTLKDVALPGLEAVRETEQALPQFEAPFALTSETVATKGKQGSLLGAAALSQVGPGGRDTDPGISGVSSSQIRAAASIAPMASHAPTNDYDYQAARAAGVTGPDASGHWPSAFKRDNHPRVRVGGFDTRTGARVPGTPQAGPRVLAREGWAPEDARRMGAGGLDLMPSHGANQGGSTVDPSWRGAAQIGPEPAPPSPRPYITPPGLFDKGTSRLSDFLATPATVGHPQRFPLDEALELSGIGDPSQHMPAGALSARIRAAAALARPAP